MSIFFKRNEERAVIGHDKLPFRVRWQVFLIGVAKIYVLRSLLAT